VLLLDFSDGVSLNLGILKVIEKITPEITSLNIKWED
jgi:hypothetical protein